MKTYLIIKLGALGDVAMATSILSSIKADNPDATVTWVAGSASSALLKLTGLVDEIIVADERVILNGSFLQKVKAVSTIFLKLLGRKFDFCLVPYRDWRYHLLHMGARCKAVLSFRGEHKLIPGRYHGSEYLRLALGNQFSSNSKLALPVPALKNTPQADVPQILLAPGSPDPHATDWNRQWPLSHYVELAQKLCAEGLSVGIVGIDSTEVVDSFFKEMDVKSYINKTNLTELLQVLSSAKVLVCHDSGVMHLMTMCGGACVSIFGPTLAMEKVFPSPQQIALHSSEAPPCMPCYDGKKYTMCEKRECMRLVTPEQVFNATIALLKRK